MSVETYAAQVALLVRAIPEIAPEEAFALKGGTAINLFVRNLPRLSVDIDLVYLPVETRDASLAAIRAAFARIADRLRKRLGATVNERASNDGTRLVVRAGGAQIKIELSPVLRGTVFEPELRGVNAAVEDRFGYAEMAVVALPDLYAGKIAAALDRQHPRDLFDIKYLYANEGITDDIFRAFLVYLISHSRPPHELLDPRPKDLAAEYDGEFRGMTVDPVSLDELIAARATLIEHIQTCARRADARAFLEGFTALAPDFTLLGLAADVAALPAVQWKIQNLERFQREQPQRFEAQLAALTQLLAH
jgi:predicted nucleotidyltransferase component of viral defense system